MARYCAHLAPLAALCLLVAPPCQGELSLEEAIGLLFLIPACPARGEEHLADLLQLMQKRQISALLMKGGDPLLQVQMIEHLEKSAACGELFVAIDAECGLGMRMETVERLPSASTLGERGDLDEVERMGALIGEQCRQVRTQLNLAPVADVEVAENPIIGARSFGSDSSLVAKCAVRMVTGMARSGVLSCGKHFPGHGGVVVDSHLDLPRLEESQETIEERELMPFRALIAAQVPALMTAHIVVPALDPEELPATLSPAIVRGWLQERLGFEGCVITDALNMRALTRYFSHEEIAVGAIRAGCHLLLYGDHIAPQVDELLREVVPRAWHAIWCECQRDPAFCDAVYDAAAHVLQLRAHNILDL